MRLDWLNSMINGYPYAKDRNRAFTFIEFIKEFGGENTDEEFLTSYTEYLNLWSAAQSGELEMSKEEFVRQKMVGILRTIALTYSSYEEQQFLKTIDWNDKEQIKTTVPLFVRKIREICEFYRKKRNNIPLIIKKNSMKGSYKSVTEVIYDKIVDFIFNNRHLQPQMAELKQNLSVSIEQYVDTYSEYFDVPREQEYRIEKEREYMIGANMNDVDYRDYIKVNEVVNEILYSGEVYLYEIGLMADLGLDLTQECVGDLLELKNELLNEAALNQVPLTDQIHMRRRFYEKFLGCDLYYMFMDGKKNVTVSLLCSALNPSGNLLNCDHPDRAVTQGKAIELLTHVGLFFKPDKTSILKVNARDYTWRVDKDNVEVGKIYVFPDPSRYGNIGNNKIQDYPLIMTYNLDYDIRNISSGLAEADPLVLLDETAWQSYYSKQQDVFKIVDNKNFDYSFTSLANMGFIENYQTDIYNNEFALYKGYEVSGSNVNVPSKFLAGFTTPDSREAAIKPAKILHISGGQFEDPTTPHQKQSPTLKLGKAPIITPDLIYDHVNGGDFGVVKNIKYIDNFDNSTQIARDEIHPDIVSDLIAAFQSQTEINDNGLTLKGVNKSFIDIHNAAGNLFIKNNNALSNRPQSLANAFPWLPDTVKNKQVINFHVKKNTLIYETKNEYVFVPYLYENGTIIDNTGLNELLILTKNNNILYSDLLWCEAHQAFYIAVFNKYMGTKSVLVPSIYKFNPVDYSFKRVVSGWDAVPSLATQLKNIEKTYNFDNDRFTAFQQLVQSKTASAELNNVFCNAKYNFENFAFTNFNGINFGKIVLSYNNNLDMFLIAYLINDSTGNPHLYEHKFRITTNDLFNKSLVSTEYATSVSAIHHEIFDEDLKNPVATISGETSFFRPL